MGGVWICPARLGHLQAIRVDEVVGRYDNSRLPGARRHRDGRQVAVEASIRNVTPVGGELRDEELHLWTFDDAGKVMRLAHYVDTAKHAAAHHD